MLLHSGITCWPANREGGLSEAYTVQTQGELFESRQFTFCSLGGGQVTSVSFRGTVWYILTRQGWWQKGQTSSELPSSCRYEQAMN